MYLLSHMKSHVLGAWLDQHWANALSKTCDWHDVGFTGFRRFTIFPAGFRQKTVQLVGLR